jgi:hypothetical protein
MGSIIIGGTAATALPTSAAATNIVNLALLRVGAKPITSLTSNDANAIKAALIYPYAQKLVLQQKDWRFAKLRATLTRHSISPLYGYTYAYELPTDFLRLCLSHYPQMPGLNPIAFPPGYWYSLIDATGYPRYYQNYDPVVYPGGFPFVFEIITDPAGIVPDCFCLLTDYDDTDIPISIDYIRLATDESLYTPAFTESLICRLAMDFSIPIAESLQKKNDNEKAYMSSLVSTGAVNESLDSLQDETGSDSWVNAGR